MVCKTIASDVKTHQLATTTLLRQSHIAMTKLDEVQDLAKETSNISTVVDMDDAASATSSSSVGKTYDFLSRHMHDIDELASLQSQMTDSDRIKAWNAKRDRLEALSQAALAKDFRNLAGVTYSCMGSPEDEYNEITVPEDWRMGKWA
jgi:hypothetical protein